MQQHVSKYLARRLLPTLGVVSLFNFSEHGHIAYQIKWNHACSNMLVNILPAFPHPPSPNPQVKVKIKLFQNMVMLHIKLKGFTHTAT